MCRKHLNRWANTPQRPSSPEDNRKTITSGQFGRTNAYLKSVPRGQTPFNESTSSSRDSLLYRSDRTRINIGIGEVAMFNPRDADSDDRYKIDCNLALIRWSTCNETIDWKHFVYFLFASKMGLLNTQRRNHCFKFESWRPYLLQYRQNIRL